jgi:hypothetical protein
MWPCSHGDMFSLGESSSGPVSFYQVSGSRSLDAEKVRISTDRRRRCGLDGWGDSVELTFCENIMNGFNAI